MAPIRLKRSAAARAASSSSLTSPAEASGTSTPRRSSGKAAAARMSLQQAAEARYLAGDADGDNDEDAEGESTQGRDESHVEARDATMLDGSDGAFEDEEADDYRRASGSSRQGRSASRRGTRARSSRQRRDRHSLTKVEDDTDEDSGEPDEHDVEDEEEIDDGGSSLPQKRRPGRPRGSLNKKGRISGRGRESKGRGRSRARQYGANLDEEQDEDEEEEEEGGEPQEDQEEDASALPSFKKRHSRSRGFRIVVDNGQTAFNLVEESDGEGEASASAAAANRGRGRGRGGRGRGAAGPRRPGRRPRTGLPATRLIEDSEDEDSADDRPRPKGPPPYDEPSEVPPMEMYRCKVQGNIYGFDMDELVLPDDPDGAKKIDKYGNLLGDRKWKPASFTSSLRADPHKVYFLAVDAARAVGFRDSLTFFRSEPRLVRLNLLQQEKEDLVAAGRLHGQQRHRNVTFVAATNVFKIYGAKAVKNGLTVIDDYYENDARIRMEQAGKIDAQGQPILNEDPRTATEKRRDGDRDRDRTKRPPDSITCATSDPNGRLIQTMFGDNGASPFVRSFNWPSRRANQQRANLTEENWLMEMSGNVQGMNNELAENRLERLEKFRRYDGGDIGHEEQFSSESRGGKAGGTMDMDEADAAEKERAQVDAHYDEANETKRARQRDLFDHAPHVGPVGFYDPMTNLPHFSVLTQPTKARIEKVAPRPVIPGVAPGQRPLLGGGKVGTHGWGLMTWNTDLGVQRARRDEPAPWMTGGVKRLPAASGGEDPEFEPTVVLGKGPSPAAV
ncbi:unnamed protein product [Jaminaea pallidilutea]